MMRIFTKIFLILLVLSFVLPLFSTEIKGAIIYTEKETTFKYTISIVDVNKLAGLGFTLTYDSTVVEFINVQKVDLGSNSMMEFNNVMNGNLLISMIDGNGINNSGKLLEVTFKAIGEVGEFSEIIFADCRTYDTDLLDLPITFFNGSVTIVNS